VSDDVEIQSFERNGFAVSTDRQRLDPIAIHDYLCNRSYWAEGRPLETVRRSLANSLCFGLYDQDRQIGLARVVTDYATYGYMCDVYVLEDYRGKGLGKWLVECVMAHPALQNLRKFSLATRDAQELYRRFGFTEIEDPKRYMNLRKTNQRESP
jgi:ribosomal protein S18 acetylase RimI-like enzyme